MTKINEQIDILPGKQKETKKFMKNFIILFLRD